MTTYTSWVTRHPNATTHVEVEADSAKDASAAIRRKYPGSTFTLPRAEDKTFYSRPVLYSQPTAIYDKAPA